jgi:hypothetical protein
MSTAVAAYLHAHGLRVEPSELDAAVLEAVSARRAVLYPFGDTGLPTAESAVLERGGFDLEQRDYGVDDPALKTAVEHAAILSSGLTTAQAARRLGVSEARVRQRLGQRTLYGIQGRRGWVVPSFQFGSDTELPGWDRVVPHLPESLSPVELLSWLTLANVDLGGKSPRDWLLAGQDPAPVAALADGLA